MTVGSERPGPERTLTELVMVAVSAATAAFGYWLFSVRPLDGVVVQSFAAGALLTMLADSMMPEAFEHGGKLVGIFTVMGFLAAAVLAVVQ